MDLGFRCVRKFRTSSGLPFLGAHLHYELANVIMNVAYVCISIYNKFAIHYNMQFMQKYGPPRSHLSSQSSFIWNS